MDVAELGAHELAPPAGRLIETSILLKQRCLSFGGFNDSRFETTHHLTQSDNELGYPNYQSQCQDSQKSLWQPSDMEQSWHSPSQMPWPESDLPGVFTHPSPISFPSEICMSSEEAYEDDHDAKISFRTRIYEWIMPLGAIRSLESRQEYVYHPPRLSPLSFCHPPIITLQSQMSVVHPSVGKQRSPAHSRPYNWNSTQQFTPFAPGNQERLLFKLPVLPTATSEPSRRRERNRIAASKCRARKRDEAGILKERSARLQLANKDLKNQLDQLNHERQSLKHKLLQHSQQGCSKVLSSLRIMLPTDYEASSFSDCPTEE